MEIYKFMSKLTNELNKNLFYNIEIDKNYNNYDKTYLIHIIADKDKLFDKNVSDVIDYLSSYKDYTLRQRWNCYESNYFVFSKKEKETEEEMFERVYDIVNNKYSKLLDKKNEIASLNLKKKALQDKIAELDKQIQSL